jgi:iron complex outermembrane receptor protein
MPFAENPSSLNEEDARLRPTFVRPFIIAQGAGKSVKQGQFGLAYSGGLSETGKLDLSGWGLLRDVWNPIPGRIISLGRGSGGLRASYAGGTLIGKLPFTWIAGADFSYLGDDREEFENLGVDEEGDRAQEGELLVDQRETVGALGPFVTLTLAPSSAVRVTAGGRFDFFDFQVDDHLLEDGDDSGERTFTHFSPMVGVDVAANDWLNLYANVATAFQTPTTSELSNQPSGAGGFNPLLDPETTLSFSVGAKGIAAAPSAQLRRLLLRGGGEGRHPAVPGTGRGGVLPERGRGDAPRDRGGDGMDGSDGARRAAILHVSELHLRRVRDDRG